MRKRKYRYKVKERKNWRMLQLVLTLLLLVFLLPLTGSSPRLERWLDWAPDFGIPEWLTQPSDSIRVGGGILPGSSRGYSPRDLFRANPEFKLTLDLDALAKKNPGSSASHLNLPGPRSESSSYALAVNQLASLPLGGEPGSFSFFMSGSGGGSGSQFAGGFPGGAGAPGGGGGFFDEEFKPEYIETLDPQPDPTSTDPDGDHGNPSEDDNDPPGDIISRIVPESGTFVLLLFGAVGTVALRRIWS